MSSTGLRIGRRALLSSRGARSFASSTAGGGFSYPGARSLEQIVKLELLEGEQPPKIRSVWEDFHAGKDDAVATALGASEFQALVGRAAAAPFFVFPVYRHEGFFNMLCQFQQSCFLVTSLEAFKENPGAAPPCVAVSLYDDLLARKELALVRADVINMLDKKEAQLLLQQLLASYQDDTLYEHVHKFNNQPEQFDFEAYRALLKDATTP
ncbi:ATP synthase mitochondrial F1 complex assembly factor 1 [Phytophthora pseudosyringae]|uniref:ATP synthase mitochondrial F1 complex assembly factor 1 n=1 Tax=Phytophthora pseudosyringae TaxID=221518 RepID=A0A8T1VCL0_9STRA|nr:ATP synthase mitochondrial F1 complex assembly factor 1 [Phytophthora pseudosyringae]